MFPIFAAETPWFCQCFCCPKCFQWSWPRKNPNVYEELNWQRLFRTDYWGLDMFEALDGRMGGWRPNSAKPLLVDDQKGRYIVIKAISIGNYHDPFWKIPFTTDQLKGMSQRFTCPSCGKLWLGEMMANPWILGVPQMQTTPTSKDPLKNGIIHPTWGIAKPGLSTTQLG